MKTNSLDQFYKKLEKKSVLEESLVRVQKQKWLLKDTYGAEYGCDTTFIQDMLILDMGPCGELECKCRTHEMLWCRGKFTGCFWTRLCGDTPWCRN